jgi:hypothetical protein
VIQVETSGVLTFRTAEAKTLSVTATKILNKGKLGFESTLDDSEIQFGPGSSIENAEGATVVISDSITLLDTSKGINSPTFSTPERSSLREIIRIPQTHLERWL